MSPTARAAVAATVFFAAFTAVLLSGLLDPATLETVSGATFIVLGLIYVPLAVRTARAAHGRLKAAWVAMTIGFASWLLGEVLWAYYHWAASHSSASHSSAEAAPLPSWADAAYLAYAPWVCVALLLFPTARSWRSQAQMILDGVIVAGSFFLISWMTAMRSVWHSVVNGALEFAVSVAYPVSDVLVMTVGLLVAIRAAPGLRLTLTLLVAGLMAAALSMWVYESNTTGYSAGSLVNLRHAANSLLIIVALVQPATGPHPVIPPPLLRPAGCPGRCRWCRWWSPHCSRPGRIAPWSASPGGDHRRTADRGPALAADSGGRRTRQARATDPDDDQAAVRRTQERGQIRRLHPARRPPRTGSGEIALSAVA